jgi:hypothetical protein
MEAVAESFDVITTGRIGVDLYPLEVGRSLVEVSTFAKSLGGGPTNVAVAARRLGCRCAVITKVGEDPFGVYLRKQPSCARRSCSARASRPIAVTTYSGPKGAVFSGAAYHNNSGKQANLRQALNQGQNAVFLLAAPANGTYQLKADVTPPSGATGSATFGQEVTLQRSC